MTKQPAPFTTAFAHSKKVVLSIALAGAMVFTNTTQAFARVDLGSFMQRHAEFIISVAHPSVRYVSSYYEGSGILSITYRSPWSGKNLTMQLRGQLDGNGNFSTLSVVSDQAKFRAFVAADLSTHLLGQALQRWASGGHLSYAQSRGLELAATALRRNDTEAALEKILYVASL